MSVFKYVTARGALRYLRTWALRITPADKFDDPFEMRPTFDMSTASLMERAPPVVRQELAAKFAEFVAEQGWGEIVGDVATFSTALVSFFMRRMSAHEEELFLRTIRNVGTVGVAETLHEARTQFEEMYRQAMGAAQVQLPLFSKLARDAMHQTLPQAIGVLCLSGSNKHPLMWAQYTDSHKGALLEFDETAPCFNRRRYNEDEFGCLRRVWYSDSRPAVTNHSEADAVVALALTKPLEWSYEQELRLLWPLELSERKVDGVDGTTIHLINVPATALRSVTIGCKAADDFTIDVLQAITAASPPARLVARAASMDDHSFSLNYHDLF
jgi:hypothetical protein